MSRRGIAIIFALALLSIAYVYGMLSTAVVKAPEGAIFYVQPGTSKQKLQAQLAERQLNPNPILFKLYVLLHPQANLKAGEYFFPQHASMRAIWRQVVTGKGLYYRTFTIVPGWTTTQIQAALNNQAGIRRVVSQVNLSWRQSLAYPDKQVEGQLLPDTYKYTFGTTDNIIFSEAARLMKLNLTAAWQQRAADLPYADAYEALIAASLIEKEAYLASERPIIAGVLVNRLKKGMRLQFDPTVIYGLGVNYDGQIHKSDLQRDTPYNTYVHKGLPPSPIAMPSLDAIHAALHPAVHDYYYFVARGDGSHQFSQSLDQHNKAVRAAKHATSMSSQTFNNTDRIAQLVRRHFDALLAQLRYETSFKTMVA